MTKDMAYEVLGLVSDASKEEIQKAYAELSKKYHPEENPEEFQRIHEAYRMLIRGKRGRRQTESVGDTGYHAQINMPQKDEQSENMQFKDGQMQNLQLDRRVVDVNAYSTDDEIEESVPQYDFDEAERKAQQEVYLREVQTAMDKLDDIIGIIFKRSINDIILKEQLEKLPMEIRLSPQYMGKLYAILKDRFVDDDCYDLLTEQLHLWDEDLLENYEYIAQFKDFIDQKKVEYWLPEVRNRRVYPMLAVFVGAILLAVFCFLKATNLI